MASIHRIAAVLALLVLHAGCANAPLGKAPAFDHYDPAKLRAAANERDAAGDAATARILRARADRLAPHEPRAAPAAPPASSPASPPPLAPEPPALWPSR